ncbi:MAG: SMC-Scp complex subunit ScpB [Candidatus Micrarchaeota archaeon]|nr:SMC-Scp complex subunit ScpB [Candidatus Micrarchaeota archaeon]
MKKSKVFVYIKPKGQENLSTTVIKTDKLGNIIKEERIVKEKKDEDIEKVIEKTIKTPEIKENTQEKKDEKLEKQKTKIAQEQEDEKVSYFSFLKILEPSLKVYQQVFVNYNSELLKMTEEQEVKKVEPDYEIEKHDPTLVLEAALFMAVDGLPTQALAKLINKDRDSTEKLLLQLKEKYMQKESAIEITNELKNKWIMRLKQEYAKPARQFATDVDISKHALKTLAFIAKNENITKRELFKKLGSQIYTDVAELEQKGFIKLIPFGRTSRIKLTEKFNQYFGI